jgi:hypothetical protein
MPKINVPLSKFVKVLARVSPASRPRLAQKFSIVTRAVVFAGSEVIFGFQKVDPHFSLICWAVVNLISETRCPPFFSPQSGVHLKICDFSRLNSLASQLYLNRITIVNKQCTSFLYAG